MRGGNQNEFYQRQGTVGKPGPGGTAPVYRVSSGGADCTESNRIGAGERCFQALREIRNVLDDSGLTDPECFAEIEKIISVLEELGVGCGRRHDF